MYFGRKFPRDVRFYVMLTTSLLLAAAMLGLPRARAQGRNQVGLVIRFGDGSVITRCVAFDEGEISGYDVLTRSGLKVVIGQASGLGTSICQIEGQGCPASNCFCSCTGSSCAYWSYWHQVDGAWSYAPVGASSYKVRHGDVQAWSWGAEELPPAIPFEQVCAPTPTATTSSPATPLPTDTLTPSPTPTPSPTDTPTHLPTLTLPLVHTSTPAPTHMPTLPPTQTLTPSPSPTPPSTSTSTPSPPPPLQRATPAVARQSTTSTNYFFF
ncbi:MAG: hypothetical protein ACFFGP_08785, partial [Promethearchaeota archaeon]